MYTVLGVVRDADCVQRPICEVFQCRCMRATQLCVRRDGAVSGGVLGPCTWVCGGWGVMGVCVHSESGMVGGVGCTQRPACVVFQCGCMRATRRYASWDGAVSSTALGPCTWVCGGVGHGGWVPAQCVGHGESCGLRAAPRMREFPVLLHATKRCSRWDGVVCGAALGLWSCVGEGSAGVFGGWCEMLAARSAPTRARF